MTGLPPDPLLDGWEMATELEYGRSTASYAKEVAKFYDDFRNTAIETVLACPVRLDPTMPPTEIAIEVRGVEVARIVGLQPPALDIREALVTGHSYVEHPTYTGPGCAMCGKHVSEHASAIVERTMPRISCLI